MDEENKNYKYELREIDSKEIYYTFNYLETFKKIYDKKFKEVEIIKRDLLWGELTQWGQEEHVNELININSAEGDGKVKILNEEYECSFLIAKACPDLYETMFEDCEENHNKEVYERAERITEKEWEAIIKG